ncbi:MAG: efflux transporter outer membrane subunit [Gemmatimonadetes bacterium]|nr:efflux transporter outer membrane subunit [Gemmatimonadota bacterium]
MPKVIPFAPRAIRPRRRAWLPVLVLAAATGCGVPALPRDPAAPRPLPAAYAPAGAAGLAPAGGDSTLAGGVGWRAFFGDSTLVALIDTAVRNNPELLATLQEVEMARNEARAIRGRLFPQVGVGASLGIDKVGRYTSEGAGNASTEMTPGKEVPEPLGDISLGFVAGWEVDIRGRIRSRKGAALARYLATVEGTRYVRTRLVAEVANSYYELAALDSKLAIIRQAVELQQRELEVVRAQKEAAVVSELAVQQFEALLLNQRALEAEVLQQQREVENRLTLLLGRFPEPVARSARLAAGEGPGGLAAGLPSQLLRNRPDIRQAELELAASKLDVKAARAEFYPEVNLAAGLGVRAFSASTVTKLPESLTYGVAGDLLAPLFNRMALKAEFARASAAQQKALVNYRRTVLEGFTEVATLVSAVGNLQRSVAFKSQQAEALDRAIGIASDLFRSARANYLEVLTAQREAIDVKLELVETQLRQRQALTDLYRALGGGWQ